jgi:hypothetical protein
MKLSGKRSGKKPSLKERLFQELILSVVAFVCLAVMLAVIALPVNGLQGSIVPWMIEHLPWLFEIAVVWFVLSNICLQLGNLSLTFILPLSLMLLISSKTRRFAGYGLRYTSWVVIYNVMFLSIFTTVNFAGILWLIVGLLLFGVGVLEIAFFTALSRSEWLVALSIPIGCVIAWILHTFSEVFTEKPAKRDE